MAYLDRLTALNPALRARIQEAQRELDWVREASGNDLLRLSTDTLGLKQLDGVADAYTAVQLGNLDRGALRELLLPHYPAGTSTVDDLADQVQLCRAFADPTAATAMISAWVKEKVAGFPRTAEQLRVGTNPGDVLDPFILAANFELLSERSLQRTIEHTASHKILMKIEDMVGHLHEAIIGQMRGNFRIPEPAGSRAEGKERLDPFSNPFPGADVGQVPLPERPDRIRLFQVKSKTGSAKGGDGKRLGEQLQLLADTYQADTFYVAIVGNTLRGHRSRGAVESNSPDTAILVGVAAHNELTQSAVGGELLLRTYQRAFREAAEATGYRFSEVVAVIAEQFERQAEFEDTDFLSAWLHEATGGEPSDQDSRLDSSTRRRRRRRLE